MLCPLTTYFHQSHKVYLTLPYLTLPVLKSVLTFCCTAVAGEEVCRVAEGGGPRLVRCVQSRDFRGPSWIRTTDEVCRATCAGCKAVGVWPSLPPVSALRSTSIFTSPPPPSPISTHPLLPESVGGRPKDIVVVVVVVVVAVVLVFFCCCRNSSCCSFSKFHVVIILTNKNT